MIPLHQDFHFGSLAPVSLSQVANCRSSNVDILGTFSAKPRLLAPPDSEEAQGGFRAGLQSANFDSEIDLAEGKTASKWEPEPGQGGIEALGLPPNTRRPPPADSNGPSIFTAVQEQLGLRLESQKGPVEIIVIDHAEKPAPN